jgi:hypothetical protein
MKPTYLLTRLSVALLAALLLAACDRGAPPDEARLAGKSRTDFPASTFDVARGMDGGIELTPEEIQGRNTWLFWTGGNERFWDLMAQEGYGLIDFLKLIDSRDRDTRFQRLGLINEPGFTSNPEPDEFGLFLDRPATETAGAGLHPNVYGVSTGIVGLRLFPNPNFDDKARAKWDAERFYADSNYSTHPSVVRPYRVGMTCAVCHIAPNPITPPANVESPEWTELSGTIGNQFFQNGKVFGFNLDEDDLLHQLLAAVLPGTVDTSIMATDYNNNPNIINGIFLQGERLRIAQTNTVDGGALLLPPHSENRAVPHVLVDGADSIGVTGALARVFINVGTYSEEWLRAHNAIIGLRKTRPIRIEDALEQSVSWQATLDRMDNLAQYLIRAGQRIPLADAPGGEAFLDDPPELVARGKIVFAENCFSCHSSKQPPPRSMWTLTQLTDLSQKPEYVEWARQEVMKPDFLENNYLATDERIPVTLLQTNAARALQDNATTGKVWHDFSSVDYKQTPSVGSIEVLHPFTLEPWTFDMPGGGPGFYRVPSLVGIWSSAPFFHNNALGLYNHDPSVAGRMEAFDDAIRKMFWSELRDGPASIAITTQRTYVKFAAHQLPVLVKGVVGPASVPFLNHPWILAALLLLPGIALIAWARHYHRRKRGWRLGTLGGVFLILLALVILPANFFAAGKFGAVNVGPIPKGMPLSLLVNIDPEITPPHEAARALGSLYLCLRKIKKEDLDDEAALDLIARDAAPALLRVNKAPDFIRDRGHYFAAHLSDEDKEALIAFLKRF